MAKSDDRTKEQPRAAFTGALVLRTVLEAVLPHPNQIHGWKFQPSTTHGHTAISFMWRETAFNCQFSLDSWELISFTCADSEHHSDAAAVLLQKLVLDHLKAMAAAMYNK